MKPAALILAVHLTLAVGAADGQALSLLPEAPQPAAVHTSFDHILAVAAWPGYRLAARDRTRLGHGEKTALTAERLAFVLDLATTAAAVNRRSLLVERNPMNTCFGDRNRAGILASMAVWEIGYSYASALAPRWFSSSRAGPSIKRAAILIGGAFAEEHFREGLCNLRLMGKNEIAASDHCQLFP